MGYCDGSNKIMKNLANLDSTSSCDDVHHVMKTIGKRWYCAWNEVIQSHDDTLESFEKFPGLFTGEYTTKCPELKTILDNWKSIGDVLSSRIGAALNPATFALHHDKLGKLSDSDVMVYNLYIVKHQANHLSAYFEEPKSYPSKRSHFVFQVVSWGTKNYFETMSADPDDIIKNIHKAFFGVPGFNKNVFNEYVPEEILRFQFPLGQMHKAQQVAPAKGDIWDTLSNSCAGKIFQIVKYAFKELGTADLEHSSPFYEPNEVFGFLKNLANEVPNGHLLSENQRDAIVDDAFAYGVKNWADTFDEPIDMLPPKPKKEISLQILKEIMALMSFE